jgi:hypothetical protein
MKFAHAGIDGLLDNWARHAEEDLRAQGQNLRCEARLTGARGAAIDAFLTPPPTTLDDLRERYIDYVRERVVSPTDGIPETFTALNAEAAVSVSPDVILVRLENLRYALDAAGLTFEQLQAALSASDGLSRDLVARFLRIWNQPDIRPNPVSFAAIRSELVDEVTAPDWPEKLRDRLGLAFYNGLRAPIPVALVQYEAADVDNSGGVFRAPTVADTKPWEIYFPTPSKAAYGCPMSLEPRDYDDALVAEILHPRILYQRHHLIGVGWITSDRPAHSLETLRNNHLWALRIALDAEPFGQEL